MLKSISNFYQRKENKMKNHIKTGDIVSVNFNNAKITLCSKAEVIYIPQTTGDSWIFKNLETNEIYYISEGCTVKLLIGK